MPHRIDRARFFSKLKLNTLTGCMEWQGGLDKGGYGVMRASMGNVRVHRVAAYFGGLIETPRGTQSGLNGINVLHRCDNPKCCNAEHLFVGTHADNTRDKISKGRAHFPGRPDVKSTESKTRDQVVRRPTMAGENNHRARFSDAQVSDMRLRIAAGINSAGEIAKEYGVRHSTIANIISGKRRKFSTT